MDIINTDETEIRFRTSMKIKNTIKSEGKKLGFTSAKAIMIHIINFYFENKTEVQHEIYRV